MKILIAADMEGISGVTNWDQVDSGHFEYPRFRKIMTEDVNAAVRGASQGDNWKHATQPARRSSGPCGGYATASSRPGAAAVTSPRPGPTALRITAKPDPSPWRSGAGQTGRTQFGKAKQGSGWHGRHFPR